MTEDEAKAECARLAEEHPEREKSHWVPVRQGDAWAVARLPFAPPPRPTGTEVREQPRPPADDPRSKPWLDPPGGGIA
jgi:hypothetical protein